MGKYLLISAIVLLNGCFMQPKYLTSKYLTQKHVFVVQHSNETIITVTGLCGHSALGVDKAELSVVGDTIYVEFPLCRGKSGSIEEMVSVPDFVNKVIVAGEIVWTR